MQWCTWPGRAIEVIPVAADANEEHDLDGAVDVKWNERSRQAWTDERRLRERCDEANKAVQGGSGCDRSETEDGHADEEASDLTILEHRGYLDNCTWCAALLNSVVTSYVILPKHNAVRCKVLPGLSCCLFQPGFVFVFGISTLDEITVRDTMLGGISIQLAMWKTSDKRKAVIPAAREEFGA